MALFGNSVDRRAAELRKLVEGRAAMEARMRTASKEVSELREFSADLTLDEFLVSDSGTLATSCKKRRERITVLEAELEGLQGARKALLGRIARAVLALAAAEAEAKRSQANKLEAELAKHVARRDEILKQAEELEGGGVQFVRADESMRRFAGPLDPVMVIGQVPQSAFSKAEALAAEIRALNTAADRIEEQASREIAGGQASGDSADELGAACAAHPLGPSEFEIRRWADLVIARANAEWARKEGTWMPAVDRVGPRFTMVWRDSVIDEAKSIAVNSHRSRPVPISSSVAHPPREGTENPTHGWYKSA
jgi:hypothetical protein